VSKNRKEEKFIDARGAKVKCVQRLFELPCNDLAKNMMASGGSIFPCTVQYYHNIAMVISMENGCLYSSFSFFVFPLHLYVYARCVKARGTGALKSQLIKFPTRRLSFIEMIL
jgi:hypothetical protein